MMSRRPLSQHLVALMLVCAAASCATKPARTPAAAAPPAYATYPPPDVPTDLPISATLRERHLAAWQRLQAGDLRTASREFAEVLKRAPAFYPAETGLGFADLASRNYKSASSHFSAALAAADRYLPALVGQAEALLALNRDPDAIAVMERILLVDPQHDAIKSRLELVRFRALQNLVDSGRKARAAHKTDDALKLLEQALAISPSSTLILRELALAHSEAGHLAEAEEALQKAAALEPQEAEWPALLGGMLEAQQKFGGAADAYAKAAALEPRPEWRTKVVELRTKADLAALPPEFAQIGSASTITRADAAAYIGINLKTLIDRAPKRATDVATDALHHWAAPWILPVTRAGIMTIYPNHTFQPAATVRRADLAAIVAQLLRVATTANPAELTRWQAGRPRFADLPATNTLYRPAALAVAAGAMSADADNRFSPTGSATGADLASAIHRIALLTGRQ
ncbi:MAG: tetratricopeptide repeat protein [Vicinamibacterales bacterium]